MVAITQRVHSLSFSIKNKSIFNFHKNPKISSKPIFLIHTQLIQSPLFTLSILPVTCLIYT